MVEVNGAYKHSRHKNWLKKLHVMLNVNVFATQDGRTNTTHYTGPYATHMIQKSAQKNLFFLYHCDLEWKSKADIEI